MIPLARLLDEATSPARPASHPVAFGGAGPRDTRDLRRDVEALAARLGPASGRALLLHCDDAYAFAVGLLAAAQLRARVLLPPTRQPGALRRLAPECRAALLDGSDAPEAIGAIPCIHPLVPGPSSGGDARFELRSLDRDAPLAELFTSGTTGAGKSVVKALRHLDDEVAVLEQCFGAALAPDSHILATVAPHHLYGLLFRVLWPLAAGRPFLRSAVLHPEELLPHAAASPSFAVVATPLALRHLVERGTRLPREGCRAVFSSGGPLAAQLAGRVRSALGRAPIEIYGSTETGGVAHRQQLRGDEAWRPLPDVSCAVDAEGRLVVTSPFVSAGEARAAEMRFTTGDRVALDADGGFALRGRADRVIKVGEKRLALPDMEARLVEHPSVSEAALIALEKPGAEARVGAIVVPAAPAWELLATSGRRALAKSLAEHLAPDFERVLLPRAWRFLPALPRDAQGKLPSEILRACFDRDGATLAPERVATRREEDALELELRIPWDLACLDGHFPGTPLVAGMAQVHFAMAALEELLGEAPALAGLEALKFQELLQPGQSARLRVELGSDRRHFRFDLVDAERAGRRFASGRGQLR